MRRTYIPAAILLALIALGVFLLFTDADVRGPGGAHSDEEQAAVSVPVQLQGLPREERPSQAEAPGASLVTGDDLVHPQKSCDVAVCAAATGVPVEGAVVFTSDGADDIVPWAGVTATDDRGLATLRTPDSGFLNVQANGYCPWQEPFLGEQVGCVEVHLEEGAHVHGRVLSPKGAPVAEVEVQVFGRGNLPGLLGPERQPCVYAGERAVAARTRTRHDGTFDLGGVPRGASLGVSARKRMWRLFPIYRILSDDEASGDEEIVLRIRPLYGLRLVVDTGRDATAFGVDSESMCKGNGGLIPYPAKLGDSLSPSADRGVGRNDSVFFEQIWQGSGGVAEVSVDLESLGYESFRGDWSIPPGVSVVERVHLTKRPGPHRSVHLRAVFAGGKPYDGPLRFSVLQHGGRRARILDMRFAHGEAAESLSLPVGAYTFYVAGGRERDCWWWVPAGPTRTLDVTEGEGSLEVKIELEGGGVELDVHDTKGMKVRGYDAGGRSGDRGTIRAFWDLVRMATEGDDAGKPAVLWLPAGPAQVFAELKGVGMGWREVTIPRDGSVQRVRLDLAPAER